MKLQDLPPVFASFSKALYPNLYPLETVPKTGDQVFKYMNNGRYSHSDYSSNRCIVFKVTLRCFEGHLLPTQIVLSCCSHSDRCHSVTDVISDVLMVLVPSSCGVCVRSTSSAQLQMLLCLWGDCVWINPCWVGHTLNWEHTGSL